MRTPEVSINLDRRTVFVDGREVTLQPKQYEVLRILADAGGKVLSREEIGRKVWGEHLFDSRAVDQHIARLRAKVGAQAVRTVTNAGYASEVPVTTDSKKWGVIKGIDRARCTALVGVDFDALPSLKIGGAVRIA